MQALFTEIENREAYATEVVAAMILQLQKLHCSSRSVSVWLCCTCAINWRRVEDPAAACAQAMDKLASHADTCMLAKRSRISLEAS